MTPPDPPVAPPVDPDLPRVSVIMPVRNEADFIERSLGAVIRQDYPQDRFEILVVDGMSDDATRDIVERAATETAQPVIRLLDNPKQIAPSALNVGLAEASGDIIVRVDGHCEIEPSYVSLAVKALDGQGLNGHPAGCVGGPITTVGQGTVNRTIAYAMSSRFGVGGSAFRVGSNRVLEVDSVAFPAWPRKVMDDVGLFDEELVRNQDDEYSYRLRKRGHRIFLVPEIRCVYYSRSSLRSLWRQYFQYGFWKVRVLQKHPRQMKTRQFVPPAFIAWILGSALTAWSWPGAAALLLGVGAYSTAVLMATLAAAQNLKPRSLLVLPVVFPCLHLSYGTGFLVGMVRFAGHWRSTPEKLAEGAHQP